jgi:hypothetical protein
LQHYNHCGAVISVTVEAGDGGLLELLPEVIPACVHASK